MVAYLATSVFASGREQLLWILTLVVVAVIYSTLGLASILSSLLYHQGLSAVAFLACMILVGATVLTEGLRVRPLGVEIGVFFGLAAVYLMVLLRMTIPERSHLIEYSVVAAFMYEALSERASHGRRVRLPALLAIVVTSAIGALDEGIQVLIPSRTFDVTDILFNVLAAVMAVLGIATLRWSRRFAGRALRRRRPGPSSRHPQ